MLDKVLKDSHNLGPVYFVHLLILHFTGILNFSELLIILSSESSPQTTFLALPFFRFILLIITTSDLRTRGKIQNSLLMTSIPKELLIRECRFDLFCAIYYGLLSHALKYGACIKKLSWLFQDLYLASPNNLSNFAHNSLELDNGLELRNTNYSQYWLLSFCH